MRIPESLPVAECVSIPKQRNPEVTRGVGTETANADGTLTRPATMGDAAFRAGDPAGILSRMRGMKVEKQGRLMVESVGSGSVRRVALFRRYFVLLLALIVVGALAFNWRLGVVLDDGNAQWAAGEMVVAYRMENGAMPGSWEDLKPYFWKAIHRGSLSFEHIGSRVEIDFERLPELENKIEDGTTLPNLIYLKNGRIRRWKGGDPNVIVYGSLRRSGDDQEKD